MKQKINVFLSLLTLILLISVSTQLTFATETNQDSKSQATITFVESDKNRAITPIGKNNSNTIQGKMMGFLPQTGEKKIVLWLFGIVLIELWLLFYLRNKDQKRSGILVKGGDGK